MEDALRGGDVRNNRENPERKDRLPDDQQNGKHNDPFRPGKQSDFSVDIERTYELLSEVPTGKTVVSESGFSTRDQLDDLDRVGVDAVLIGETLMRAPDLEAACRELTGGV
jgi:tRNA-dihydrouridine synthase